MKNPLTIASHNGNEILLNRKYLIPIRQVVRLLYGENLTTDIVNECAKRYFTPQRMSVFMVGAATKLEPIEQIFTGTFSKTPNISFKSFMKEEVRVLGQEDISKIEIEDISKIESPGTQGEAISSDVNVEQITKSIQSLKINQLNSDLVEIQKLLTNTKTFDLKMMEIVGVLSELPVDEAKSEGETDINSVIREVKQKINDFKAVSEQEGGGVPENINSKLTIKNLTISDIEALQGTLNNFIDKRIS